MPYRVGLVFVQQNESAMHTYIVISPPFWSSFLFRSPQKKSRVSCLYSIFSLVLYFIHSIRPGALFSGRKERSADRHTHRWEHARDTGGPWKKAPKATAGQVPLM